MSFLCRLPRQFNYLSSFSVVSPPSPCCLFFSFFPLVFALIRTSNSLELTLINFVKWIKLIRFTSFKIDWAFGAII